MFVLLLVTKPNNGIINMEKCQRFDTTFHKVGGFKSYSVHVNSSDALKN